MTRKTLFWLHLSAGVTTGLFMENGLFALGRLRYAELFPDQEARRLLDAYILLYEAKHSQNLYLQESRLRRQYRQDAQELKELQPSGRRRKKKNKQRKPPRSKL